MKLLTQDEKRAMPDYEPYLDLVPKLKACLKELNLSQRQDSTKDQLKDLYQVAVALGMYDAAEWLFDKVYADYKEYCKAWEEITSKVS